MKAIMMSIKPQHVANILNGLKTLEIRKKFPKDYVGWVYIYVTKDSKSDKTLCYDSFSGILGFRPNYRVGIADSVLNGKVVARFWCDKVDNVLNVGSDYGCFLQSESIRTGMETVYSFYKRCCIKWEDFTKIFIDKNNRHKPLFAIHITKLEIFDKPKEIKEFWNKRERMFVNGKMLYDHKFYLTRAPQSWCYIEV